jgi:hypothetical protein
MKRSRRRQLAAVASLFQKQLTNLAQQSKLSEGFMSGGFTL